MATATRPPFVQPILAVLCGDDRVLDGVVPQLESLLGPVRSRSLRIRFDYTYYEREMGRGLSKILFAFERLVDPGDLPGLKVRTNDLERTYAVRGLRAVNLDPGILSEGNVVLASAKAKARRIYLGAGIYGELELLYESERFQPLPWTYPDYRLPETIGFLDTVRADYVWRRSPPP
jgi:hypothetical protein